MKVQVYFTETSYGYATVDVDTEGKTDKQIEEEIRKKAEDIYYWGNVNWGNSDFNIESWEEEPC